MASYQHPRLARLRSMDPPSIRVIGSTLRKLKMGSRYTSYLPGPIRLTSRITKEFATREGLVGKRYVWNDCETHNGSWQTRGNGRTTKRNRSQHDGVF